MRPIDQNTLAAIGGQSTLQAAQSFSNSMSQFAQNMRAEREAQEMQKMRAVQIDQINRQNQEQEFKMKAAVGQQVLQEKALKYEVPDDKADADAWLAYGKAQEVGGYAKSAQNAYAIAKAKMSGGELPDGAPEIMKLQHGRRIAIANGNMTEAYELQQRIKKISEQQAKVEKARVESSTMSAKNIMAASAAYGYPIEEGTMAQALGDLSRALTDKLSPTLDLAQSDINDYIAQAYSGLQAKADEGFQMHDLWGGEPAKLDKQDVAREVERLIQRDIAAMEGTGTETVDVSEDAIREELLNRHAPKK